MKEKKLSQLIEVCSQHLMNENIAFTKLVSGFGNPDANILLIGEAPGAKEEEQGKPFVGQAGKNLDAFLEKLELSREDIYISNVVKYRPFRVNPKTGRKANRPPNRKEINLFLSYLHNEIEVIDPEYIVTLGNVALRAVATDFHLNIGDEHGKLTKVGINTSQYNLFPLYHPASIIYNRSLSDTYYEDLNILKNIIKQS